MSIRIEKRTPFGFKGEWGKLYKQYNSDENEGQIEGLQRLLWRKTNYVDIGQDIQLAHLSDGVDRKIELSQSVTNLINKGEYLLRKTTDAYFDNNIGDYRCVVDIGDIVKVNNQYYVCEKVDVRTIETPKEQYFYTLQFKKIFDNIITGVQNA